MRCKILRLTYFFSLEELSSYLARNSDVASTSIQLNDCELVNFDTLFQNDDFPFVIDNNSTLLSTPAQDPMISTENTISMMTTAADDFILTPVVQEVEMSSNQQSFNLINAQSTVFNEGDTIPIEQVTSNVIRRAPLQLMQQFINIPTNNNVCTNVEDYFVKKSNKRKQVFKFPREDGVMFFSDDNDEDDDVIHSPPNRIALDERGEKATFHEIEQNIDSMEVTVNENLAPLNSKTKSSKSVKKSMIKSENGEHFREICVNCKKVFKRISLHRCKKIPRPQKFPETKSSSPKIKPRVSLNVTLPSTSKSRPQKNKILDGTLPVEKELSVMKSPSPISKSMPKFKVMNIKLSKNDMENMHKCLICNKAFQLKSSLKLHIKLHHTHDICENCNYVAKTKRTFDIHRKNCGKFAADVAKIQNGLKERLMPVRLTRLRSKKQ